MGVGKQSFDQLARKLPRMAGDVAGAEAHHHRAGSGQFPDSGGQIGQRGERLRIAVAVAQDGANEGFMGDAGNGRLACLIDRRDQNMIGLVKAARELLEEVAEA